MTSYEELLQQAYDQGIQVIDYEFEGNMTGYYCNNVAFINKNAANDQERKCILAEELGHHYTAVGDLTGEDTLSKRKMELLGRKWGYNALIPFEDIISILVSSKCENLVSLAEQLEVTPEYLQEALKYYSQKYGPEINYGDYVVVFSNESLIIHPILDDII